MLKNTRTLTEKIKERQNIFYAYTIECIDLYLDDEPDKLKKFISNLLKLDKGRVIFADDFESLLEALKKHDITTLKYLRHKFECIIKNEKVV